MIDLIKKRWDMGSVKKGDRLLSKNSIKMISNSDNNSAYAKMNQILIGKGYIERRAGNIDYAGEDLFRILSDEKLKEELRQ